jgi:hypothetical protein
MFMSQALRHYWWLTLPVLAGITMVSWLKTALASAP